MKRKPSKPPKVLEPTLEDLEWSIKGRAENQQTALKIFRVIKEHPQEFEDKSPFIPLANGLIAATFSLWRAVFLADRTGEPEDVLAHSVKFLGKVLVDNAINFSQDRESREWTYNYYVANAGSRLAVLAREWPQMDGVPKPKPYKSKKRWEYHRDRLIVAVEAFTKAVTDEVSRKNTRKRKRKAATKR